MITAGEIREGMTLKINGDLYRVIDATLHVGGGKMGTTVVVKMRHMATGHVREQRFAPTEKVEDVLLEKRTMEYLYTDGEAFYFMNPETFEQVSLPKEAIGHLDKFLQPNMHISLEFYGDQPVNVLFPDVVELKVVSTPAGLHERDITTPKPATLENGMEVLVPQFIKEGDIVRIDVATGKYLERVKAEERKI
ncbi:MAG: elongation factor P [Acidobacteria bacterium]|nr:MAG: elongation factor P [Acidobacteriota bacterium]